VSFDWLHRSTNKLFFVIRDPRAQFIESMGFVDMRRPTNWDWLLVVFCPSGIIAYHGHRSGVTRPTIFLYASLGFLVSLGLFPICVRNLLLGKHSEDVKVMQAVTQNDGLSIPIALTMALGVFMIYKAAKVLSDALQFEKRVKEEQDSALMEGRKWTPPPEVIPPTAHGIPLYQDLLLYFLSPASLAGLYNRRRWGIVAGSLGLYRIIVIVSGFIAKYVAQDFYARLQPLVFKLTDVDITPSNLPIFLESLIQIGWYDAIFIPGCMTYSIYSLYKSRHNLSVPKPKGESLIKDEIDKK
jgi:hypothetical protein